MSALRRSPRRLGLVACAVLVAAGAWARVPASQVGPPAGALVIVGGAMKDAAILERFAALAGGWQAPIVVIPTAGEAAKYDNSWEGLVQFREAGFRNLTVVHTRDRAVADSEDFVRPIRQARGVFFAGGRQWRLADAYLHTRTEQELKALLDRGGVIGGSSAGATILGSFMVRGDTKSNEAMIGDHVAAFGFLRNSAIDQHVLRRNRQFDLIAVVEAHPELLGIGIDEDTAIIVKGDDVEVIGRGYVAIYDRNRQIPPSGRFYFLAPGDRYDLRTRQGLRPGPSKPTPTERVKDEQWTISAGVLPASTRGAAAAIPATRGAGVRPAIDLPTATAAIDRLVANEQAKDRIGSVTVGVVTGEGLAWTKSYGNADDERRIAATRDTVYRIGSITKQFTAVMLLQLVDQGKVRLSDPVEKYLPEFAKVPGRPAGGPPVTFVQVATMTSGLAREPDDLPTFLKGPVGQWEKVLLAALGRTKYDFEPGTRYQYSNIGYAILGAALGRAAGQPYVDYVTVRILAPLGMTHTAFEPDAALSTRLAKGYGVGKGVVDAETPAREHAGRGYKVPNGALYTTVGDLARFVAFELGGGPESVLPRKVRDDNYSRVNSSNGDLSSAYGIGFQLVRRGTRVIYGHGGSVAGYTAAAHFDRALGCGVIVLRNAGGGQMNVGAVAMQMLDVLGTPRSSEQ